MNSIINIFLLFDFIFDMKYATGYPRIRHNTVDSKANIRLLLNTEIYCEFNTLLKFSKVKE